jgi:hypothetical protein
MLFRGWSGSDGVRLPAAEGILSQSEALKLGLARGELTFDLLPSTLIGGSGFDVLTFTSCTSMTGLG